MSTAIGLRTLLVLALLFTFSAAAPPTLHADTTIIVTTTADDLTVNGNCSLREAVIAANTDAPVDACSAGSAADTITLPAGTYTLQLPGRDEDAAQTGDFDILDSTTITGAGPGLTVVDANALDRAFHIVNPAAQVTIENLTVANGDAAAHWTEHRWVCGGGILNAGALIVRAAEITHSKANYGGGVCSMGQITLTSATIAENEIDELGDWGENYGGGGLYNHVGCSAAITDTTVHNNLSWFYAGGILNLGILEAKGLVLADNHVAAWGGGMLNLGTATLTRCRIEGNSTTYEEGGGIINLGGIKITDSSLTRNSGSWFGGAIANSGHLILMRSLIANNQAGDVGGGIANCFMYGSEGGGTMEVANCTFAGNRAWLGSAVSNCGKATFTHNTIQGSISAWGAIYNDPDSDYPGTTYLRKSIVSSCDYDYPVISQGYNIDTGNTCGLTGPGDLSNTDPRLGPLADNGGPTRTMALFPGSPAIDRIPATECSIPTDQRGIPRPQPHKGRCDVGAYEFAPLAEVQWIIEDVKDLYRDGALGKAEYRTLHSQLKAAGSALLSGDNAGGCAGLQAFVDQVQTYVTQGKPTPEQAQPLLDAASRVMAIVCG